MRLAASISRFTVGVIEVQFTVRLLEVPVLGCILQRVIFVGDFSDLLLPFV